MSRTKRHKIKGQFVVLLYKLIDSPAWRELTGNEKSVYIDIRRQSYGANEQNLKLPYSQVKLSTRTTSKAIKHLVAVGLIDIVKHGGLFRQCSIYALSERWMIYKLALLPGKSI